MNYLSEMVFLSNNTTFILLFKRQLRDMSLTTSLRMSNSFGLEQRAWVALFSIVYIEFFCY